MFEWFYNYFVDKTLEENFKILSDAYAKLEKQNLFLVEKNYELVYEINDLNDTIKKINIDFEEIQKINSIKNEEYDYYKIYPFSKNEHFSEYEHFSIYENNKKLKYIEDNARETHKNLMSELKKNILNTNI